MDDGICYDLGISVHELNHALLSPLANFWWGLGEGLAYETEIRYNDRRQDSNLVSES